MYDPFHRLVDGVRLSVTQRCNLHCFYCHNEGQSPSTVEMKLSELEVLMATLSSYGIRKVKLTGGEPLVRDDITDIVSICSKYMSSVSLTTNGTLLPSYARELKEAGLERVNISLPSLVDGVVRRITGADQLGHTLEGVDAAIEAGLRPVKVNTVILRGLNTEEIPELIQFALEKSVTLQLIELTASVEEMNGPNYRKYYYSLAKEEEEIASKALSYEVNEIHDRRRYLFPVDGGAVKIEFVRSQARPSFCEGCRRLRVTADGKIKPCLLTNDGNVDVLPALRGSGSKTEFGRLLKLALQRRRPYWG